MIQWESCGGCCISIVYKGHRVEAKQLSNGWWRVNIIRTSDGLTVMHYDADTLDTVKLTAFELMRRCVFGAIPMVIDISEARKRRQETAK